MANLWMLFKDIFFGIWKPRYCILKTKKFESFQTISASKGFKKLSIEKLDKLKKAQKPGRARKPHRARIPGRAWSPRKIEKNAKQQ